MGGRRKYPDDLTGMRFGRLTVLSYAGKNKFYHTIWKCRCDCGTEAVYNRGDITSGNTRSCGCYRREIVSATMKNYHATKQVRKP